jgi:hypothetical protein
MASAISHESMQRAVDGSGQSEPISNARAQENMATLLISNAVARAVKRAKQLCGLCLNIIL